MTDQDHLQWLKERLDDYLVQLSAAQAEADRLKIAAARVEAVLEVFSGSPVGGNGKTRPALPEDIVELRADPVARESENGLGNLKRRAEFEGIRAIDATLQLLKASPEPLHHDDLCRKIFQLENSDFKRAKRSLTSMLSHAAKTGLLKQLGDGRYAIANRKMEAQNSK